MAASRALDIDKKLMLLNVIMSPHVQNSARSSEFNGLKTEQMMLLGENPYGSNEAAIQRTRDKLKSQGRVRRVKKDGNDNKRNTRKTSP